MIEVNTVKYRAKIFEFFKIYLYLGVFNVLLCFFFRCQVFALPFCTVHTQWHTKDKSQPSHVVCVYMRANEWCYWQAFKRDEHFLILELALRMIFGRDLWLVDFFFIGCDLDLKFVSVVLTAVCHLLPFVLGIGWCICLFICLLTSSFASWWVPKHAQQQCEHCFYTSTRFKHLQQRQPNKRHTKKLINYRSGHRVRPRFVKHKNANCPFNDKHQKCVCSWRSCSTHNVR